MHACPSVLVMHFSVSVSIWRVFSLTSSKSSFILVNSSITPCLVSRWILEYSFVPFVALRHRTHLSVVCLSPFARQTESLEFLLRNGARKPFMFVRFCFSLAWPGPSLGPRPFSSPGNPGSEEKGLGPEIEKERDMKLRVT